jgi:hypothetical protein
MDQSFSSARAPMVFSLAAVCARSNRRGACSCIESSLSRSHCGVIIRRPPVRIQAVSSARVGEIANDLKK